MGTKGQIQDLFQSEGMTPKEIQYDDFLDTYHVTIGVEGTEDRFIEENPDSAVGEPDSPSVNTDKLEEMRNRIQGSELPDGTVIVRDMMIGTHFRIEVV